LAKEVAAELNWNTKTVKRNLAAVVCAHKLGAGFLAYFSSVHDRIQAIRERLFADRVAADPSEPHLKELTDRPAQRADGIDDTQPKTWARSTKLSGSGIMSRILELGEATKGQTSGILLGG
jgi:hypothetical protein